MHLEKLYRLYNKYIQTLKAISTFVYKISESEGFLYMDYVKKIFIKKQTVNFEVEPQLDGLAKNEILGPSITNKNVKLKTNLIQLSISNLYGPFICQNAKITKNILLTDVGPAKISLNDFV